jgi:hypothetical protein
LKLLLPRPAGEDGVLLPVPVLEKNEAKSAVIYRSAVALLARHPAAGGRMHRIGLCDR